MVQASRLEPARRWLMLPLLRRGAGRGSHVSYISLQPRISFDKNFYLFLNYMSNTFFDYPHISVDPDICFGKPCIKGTRMPVASVLAYISGGMSIDDFLKEFDWIKKEDVLEAMAFASSMVDYRIIPFKKAS